MISAMTIFFLAILAGMIVLGLLILVIALRKNRR